MEAASSKISSGSGLELILRVQDPQRPEADIPKDFPVCGSMKEPDLVFEE